MCDDTVGTTHIPLLHSPNMHCHFSAIVAVTLKNTAKTIWEHQFKNANSIICVALNINLFIICICERLIDI
jgi:hypothetical protein